MAGFHIAAGWGPPDKRSPNDYYPTPPPITEALLRREAFPGRVADPCAGAGHIIQALKTFHYRTWSNEPYDHGTEFRPDRRQDFLKIKKLPPTVRSIVTNPPYRLAEEFIRKALSLGVEKHAWLLRIQFLESVTRYPLFHDHPPRRVRLFSRRVQVSEMGLDNPVGGMIMFAWFIWERGDYQKPPRLYWFHPDAVDKEI